MSLKPNRTVPLRADVKASVALSLVLLLCFLLWLSQKKVISGQMEILLFNKSNLCTTLMGFC